MIPTHFTSDQVAARVEYVIRSVLGLGDDVKLTPEADLITSVGLDSIESFESIMTLHEVLGVKIPDDINPKSISSIRGMADYLISRYDAKIIEDFMSVDIDARLAALRTADDFE